MFILNSVYMYILPGVVEMYCFSICRSVMHVCLYVFLFTLLVTLRFEVQDRNADEWA